MNTKEYKQHYMNYREANIDEHRMICKQIRGKSILNICFIAPAIFVGINGIAVSIYMMIAFGDNREVFVVFSLLLVMSAVEVMVISYLLMNRLVTRISYINKHMYSVADCSVVDREMSKEAGHSCCFVTVSFPDGYEQNVMVSSRVYNLAVNGKRALIVRYDVPEGKRIKLPFEIAILD